MLMSPHFLTNKENEMPDIKCNSRVCSYAENGACALEGCKDRIFADDKSLSAEDKQAVLDDELDILEAK